MSKETKPLLSDEFLDQVVNEINHLYSGLPKEPNEVLGNNERE